MRYVIVFLLIVLISSCKETTKYEKELAVYGKVIDSEGNPVAGAEVVVFPDYSKNQIGKINKNQLILEVELLYFNVLDKTEYILLEWETASELNSKMFVIEKSVNNSPEFNAIDSIDAAGNSNVSVFYEYKDFEISSDEIYSYRLKIVNNAGEFAYSSVINIQPVSPAVTLSNPFPNPFGGEVFFNYTLLDNENQYIEIVEKSTLEVLTTIEGLDDFSNHSFSFSGYRDGKHIRPGVYLCNLHYGDSLKTVKFVKHTEYDKYYENYPEFVTKTDENGLFKISYNYFPDLEEYQLISENGQVTGNFTYGGGAEIVARKIIDNDNNKIKYLISKNNVEIDKTSILEITCNTEEVTVP